MLWYYRRARPIDDSQVFIWKFAQVRAVASARSWNCISLLVEFLPKVEAHAVQVFFNFVKRFLTEILCRQHLTFAPLHQVANRTNVRILQTVVGTDRQLKLVNRAI